MEHESKPTLIPGFADRQPCMPVMPTAQVVFSGNRPSCPDPCRGADGWAGEKVAGRSDLARAGGAHIELWLRNRYLYVRIASTASRLPVRVKFVGSDFSVGFATEFILPTIGPRRTFVEVLAVIMSVGLGPWFRILVI